MTTLEEKAFLDALYADNSEDLKKFLLKLTLNPDITDDVLQETFCEACKKAEKLMVHPCPRGWLFITARLKLKEQLKLHKKFYPDTQVYDLTGINIQSQQADIEFRESLKLFLPDLEYKMLILHDGAAFTCKEIAHIYGYSEEWCKKRLQRIRKRIGTYYRNI